MVAMFVYNRSGRNEQSLQRTFYRCFLPSFGSFDQAVSQKMIFRNRPIRNKNCLWQSGFQMGQDEMSNRYGEPSIDASYQILVHMAKRFQKRRFFRNQPIRNKNWLWLPCLLMDREKYAVFIEEPPIDASYQVSVHLAKRFQRKRFF